MRSFVVAAAIVGTACGGEGVTVAPSLFSSSDDIQRVMSAAEFDTLWVVGGPEDTLLALPSMPRYDGDLGLVFFDLKNHSAYRIGAEGDVLWAWGTKGEGPGEVKNVRGLAVRSDGSVVLVDSGNRRVVYLSGDGKLLSELPITRTGNFHSVTALSGGRLAVHTSQPLLGLWDEHDEIIDVRPPARLGETDLLLHHGQTARWRDDGWVFGFGVGNGWMVFREDELLGVHPYVRHSEFPEVRWVRHGFQIFRQTLRRPTSTGRSLSVRGDTLHVLFGGGGRLSGRLIDKYDLRSGAYLGTDVLPHYANRAVVGDQGRVFTINNSDLFPSIVGLVRRPHAGNEASFSQQGAVP